MEAFKMVDILRRVRHDFGNHLQVINGYLELGWSEEAKNYIDKVIEYMTYEKMLFASLEPESALYFYHQMLSIRDLGVILRYKDIKVDNLELIIKADEPYASIAAVCRKEGLEGDLFFEASFYQETDGVKMVLNRDTGEEVVRMIKG
ncbi:MAG: Spo0B domain-containing protein [Thermosyntropha sp.]|nr:Spo0B domain-containing protein [Thermosyntropha sp.]MBO8158710.1 Spo0B domain-containing protein [Thermosyntropha sp.]